ncbi:MAG TPA: outer membrane protein transport protein [Thermoanaerobaculia bacterium]|nr:outer membrane protein transport protein [Thermoanaerobaculia bacterium]
MKTRIGVALVALLALAAAPALATDGYFQLGYGTAQNGMGGVGVALSLNTMSPATNPAGNAWVTGYDLGLAVFNPNREFTVTGSPSGYPGTFGLQPGTVKSGSTVFLMPSIGANWKLNDAMTLGVAIYGNGGMNTNYDASVFYAGRTGVDLMQLYVAPTFTYRIGQNHALGVSPVLGWQSFQAEGVGSFAPYSSSPQNLSNNGHDTSLGWGVRIGYLGKLTPWLSFGASYQTEMEMQKFEKYSGLFAEGGDFDIPENWTIGIAVQPTKELTFAFDVQQINYSNTESIGNPMLPNLVTARLGEDGGAGFGWKNVTAYKFGVQVAASPAVTVRAGYAYEKQPIPESEVLFNILAPGVIEQHITAGVSANVGAKTKLNFAVVRALSKSVTGPNPLEVPGRQTIELKMDQWIFDLGLSIGF